MCSKHRLTDAVDDELSDDAPMKPADIPDKLRALPVAEEFTAERHRWNTNEVGCGYVF